LTKRGKWEEIHRELSKLKTRKRPRRKDTGPEQGNAAEPRKENDKRHRSQIERSIDAETRDEVARRPKQNGYG
jgi:hypothetical protein